MSAPPPAKKSWSHLRNEAQSHVWHALALKHVTSALEGHAFRTSYTHLHHVILGGPPAEHSSCKLCASFLAAAQLLHAAGAVHAAAQQASKEVVPALSNHLPVTSEPREKAQLHTHLKQSSLAAPMSHMCSPHHLHMISSLSKTHWTATRII
eukprot:scaffold272853_cov22-Tisochrysis_lutea.AAC.1